MEGKITKVLDLKEAGTPLSVTVDNGMNSAGKYQKSLKPLQIER